MKGKRIDSEFLSSFISECVSRNKNTTEQIVEEARFQIKSIDDKIIEAERLKIIRSKLLDVIHNFDKPKSVMKTEDAKLLPLFEIPNQNICKFICDKIKESPIVLSELYTGSFSKLDVTYSIKQLLENKIIHRVGDILSKGDFYETYVKIVLRES
jgi:hypothetical protein